MVRGTWWNGVRGVGVTLVVWLAAPAIAQPTPVVVNTPSSAAAPQDMNCLAVARDSLVGDVYAPGRWHPLPLTTFFSEGWDEPWAGGPNGQNGEGAPRQGWLNAADGVFYRLAIATFDFAKDTGNGNNLTSAISVYTPFNRRFELRWDIPVVISNRGPFPGKDYHVSTPDFQLTPRFALSETEDSAQSLDVTFRMPTGDVFNGQGKAAVSPFYNFWVNPWAGLVVRGGVGFGLPFGYQSVDVLGARSRFLSNLAFGYYFTPHDWAPMGDTVWYLSTNFDRPIDNRGPNNNNVSITPGLRIHLGWNWYGLAGVELPLTRRQPFDYQVLSGLMKVW